MWLDVTPPMSVAVCEAPRGHASYSRTLKLEAGCVSRSRGQFLVEGITRGHDEFDYWRLREPSGQLKYTGWNNNLYFAETDPALREHAAQVECNRRGQPKIGMTTAQATASCWGHPLRVNSLTVAGRTEDQFVYSGQRYLYFVNGSLTAIQVAR
jgi:hypothetical protein